MTCRFHSFITSFSPSLTSVNSSSCWKWKKERDDVKLSHWSFFERHHSKRDACSQSLNRPEGLFTKKRLAYPLQWKPTWKYGSSRPQWGRGGARCTLQVFSSARERWIFTKGRSHRCSLLPEPLWISLILAVQIHFLGTEGHAAVAVEIKAVVSADVSPLLLQLAIFSFKEFRKTRFGPFGPGGHGEGNRTEVPPLISPALPMKSKWLLLDIGCVSLAGLVLKPWEPQNYLQTSMWVTAVLFTGPLRLKAKPGWLWMSWGLPTYEPS